MAPWKDGHTKAYAQIKQRKVMAQGREREADRCDMYGQGRGQRDLRMSELHRVWPCEQRRSGFLVQAKHKGARVSSFLANRYEKE